LPFVALRQAELDRRAARRQRQGATILLFGLIVPVKAEQHVREVLSQRNIVGGVFEGRTEGLYCCVTVGHGRFRRGPRSEC
jgi:hypothetical protein